jgi:hypothetical protein
MIRSDATDMKAFEEMLERFAFIEREHEKSGPNRTYEQSLGCFTEFVLAVVKATEATGYEVPSAVRVVLNDMAQHLDPYFPSTHPRFLPPAARSTKSVPTSQVARADKALATALCDVLIVDEGEPAGTTYLRVAHAMRTAGYNLPGERPRKRTTRRDPIAVRLEKWRKELSRLKQTDRAWYARARAWVAGRLAERKRVEASQDVLIACVIGRLCQNAASSTNAPLP